MKGAALAWRVSEHTIYTWRKRFGTFQADDVRRLKHMEAENAQRGRRQVAEAGVRAHLVVVPAPALDHHRRGGEFVLGRCSLQS